MSTDIDFDYIFITTTSAFDTEYPRFNIKPGSGVVSNKKLNIGQDDLRELVKEIEISNKINEKIYLVIEKSGKLLYYPV